MSKPMQIQVGIFILNIMKRIYHPYWLWEDYQNGMYELNEDNTLIDKSKDLLSNSNLFFKTMLDVLTNYKISSENNLSNVNCNRRAWLGQASCNYLFRANEKQVRVAWSELTESQRINANIEADKIIRIYEKKHNEVYKGLGRKMLF